MGERIKDRAHLIAFRWTWWQTWAGAVGLVAGFFYGSLWTR